MLMVDVHDVQGNVVYGYRYRTTRFAFFEVTDAGAARRWLSRELLERGHPAPGPWSADGPPEGVAVNVAFTHAGLAALGVPGAQLATFPADFRQGMYARLGTGLGEPDGRCWWEREWYRFTGDDPVPGADARGPTRRPVHVLVAIHSGSGEGGDDGPGRALADRLAAANGRDGVAHLGTTRAEVTRRDRHGRNVEHFGFADGLSQPYLDGVVYPARPGRARRPYGSGAMVRRRHHRAVGWRGLHPGEFILGYPDEDRRSPALPTPLALVRSGSYLVYRRIRQDVDAFESFRRDCALTGRDQADLAAKVVGRTAAGEPLVPARVDDADLNGFDYRDDNHGYRCPAASHIRRANPRDGLAVDPSIVNRHRMIRRGMPYGPPHGGTPDGRDRGLVFVAYCASISRQFEFVQREWLNDGNILGQGHSRDVFAGAAGAFTVPDRACPLTLGPTAFVRPVGGEYLFQPGMRALATLAAGGFTA